jgi:hypothetical protein
MALDVEKLVQEMVNGAAAVLAARSPEVRRFVAEQFRRLAEELARIEARKVAGTIGEEEARLLVGAQKDALRTVLKTAQGLGLLEVERAINAALAAIRAPVQKALEWVVL